MVATEGERERKGRMGKTGFMCQVSQTQRKAGALLLQAPDHVPEQVLSTGAMVRGTKGCEQTPGEGHSTQDRPPNREGPAPNVPGAKGERSAVPDQRAIAMSPGPGEGNQKPLYAPERTCP